MSENRTQAFADLHGEPEKRKKGLGRRGTSVLGNHKIRTTKIGTTKIAKTITKTTRTKGSHEDTTTRRRRRQTNSHKGHEGQKIHQDQDSHEGRPEIIVVFFESALWFDYP